MSTRRVDAAFHLTAASAVTVQGPNRTTLFLEAAARIRNSASEFGVKGAFQRDQRGTEEVTPIVIRAVD